MSKRLSLLRTLGTLVLLAASSNAQTITGAITGEGRAKGLECILGKEVESSGTGTT